MTRLKSYFISDCGKNNKDLQHVHNHPTKATVPGPGIDIGLDTQRYAKNTNTVPKRCFDAAENLTLSLSNEVLYSKMSHGLTNGENN